MSTNQENTIPLEGNEYLLDNLILSRTTQPTIPIFSKPSTLESFNVKNDPKFFHLLLHPEKSGSPVYGAMKQEASIVLPITEKELNKPMSNDEFNKLKEVSKIKFENNQRGQLVKSPNINPPVEIPIRLVEINNIIKGQKKIRNTRSNHYIWIHNCSGSEITFVMNQKVSKIVITDCQNCTFQFWDSLVIKSRSVDFVNCHNCSLYFDCVDARNIKFLKCSQMTLQLSDEESLIEYFRIYCLEGKQNKIEIVTSKRENPNLTTALGTDIHRTYHLPDVESTPVIFYLKLGIELSAASPHYSEWRTPEDVFFEIEYVKEESKKCDEISNNQWEKYYLAEYHEFEEPIEDVKRKVKQVAQILKQSKHTVVYTGAGVSTSASIPDYRGPEGAWTLRDTGGIRTKESVELSQAYPTYSHYALVKLLKNNMIHFISSTNLDGLHRRSGVPEDKISEMHGNCYREVCGDCRKEYLRPFDVLLTRDDRWTHLTGRKCSCGGPLKDTIVHFSETVSPHLWQAALYNSRKADTSLVLGTSMYVHPAASLPDKVLSKKNGHFILVNLQHTPYDHEATVRIYTKTDIFMNLLMEELKLNPVDMSYDHVKVLYEEEEKIEERAQANQFKSTLVGLGVIVALVGLIGFVPKVK